MSALGSALTRLPHRMLSDAFIPAGMGSRLPAGRAGVVPSAKRWKVKCPHTHACYVAPKSG